MNQAPWSLLDDTEDLREAEQALLALSQVLEEEQAAVRKLALAPLEELARAKGELMVHLASIAARAGNPGVAVRDAGAEPMRQRVRAAARRMVAQAQANAALLSDAIAVISDALGLQREDGTYDARARRRSSVQAYVGRRA